MEVKFYDTVNDELLKFAVIISQRTEFGTVKGHRQSQQGRDKTGYGQCPYKDAGV